MTESTPSRPQRLLRLPQVRDLTGLGTTKIYELEAAGQFPKRVKLTPRSVAWPESEVAQWTAARIAERDRRSLPEQQTAA